ncbi:MAG: hypothetical protein ACE5HT_15155 [Gemmatimonadales bacterium]
MVEKFQACGILKHGFARVSCGGCKHEFLLGFSCKCPISVAGRSGYTAAVPASRRGTSPWHHRSRPTAR